MFRLLLWGGVLIGVAACATRPPGAAKVNPDLDEVAAMMTGRFNSAEQASRDTAFFDISLTMRPIWGQRSLETTLNERSSENALNQVRWLYVEQAVSKAPKRPYRQRVYRVSALSDGTIESRVYELPQPERFVHAWERPEVFDQITPDSLVVREGCAVYLKKQLNGCYAGATREQDCGSTLYGANYATSEVEVCPTGIVSWDRGWDAEGAQVWGAEKAGYVFRKISD